MLVTLDDGTVIEIGGTVMVVRDSTTLFPSNLPMEICNIYKSVTTGTVAVMLKSPRGVRMNFKIQNLRAGTINVHGK